MGTAIGASGGGSGLLGRVTGSTDAINAQAAAAAGAAKAARFEAKKAFGVAAGNYRAATGIQEQMTTEGLAALDKQLASQEKNLSRQEQLISQIDPTVIEASQQALALLRGEESKTLAPVRNQRERQRQKLLNRLREQLGPGAETSSAGIQALNQFDAETDNLLAGAQQSSLSQLGGLAQQFTSTRPDILREIQGLGGITGMRADLQERQAQGLFQRGQLEFQAMQPRLQTAGAGFAGAQVRAQGQMAQSQQFSQLLGQAAGAAIGGMSGGGMGGFGGGFGG